MEGSGQMGENSSDILNCVMHKDAIAGDKEPYVILSFLTPLDSRIWTERSDEWNLVFRVYTWLFAAVYLTLGVLAVVMIYKKDCVRMKAKTFLAMYTAIAILGFTRFLFYSLDTYGLVGFIHERFDRWIIISRLFGVFGFPSLVASYSLMFLTLLKVAKPSLNRQWYQYWKFVGPITALPYIIALSAELIGNTAPYPALIAVVVCEGLFTFWGIIICIVYLFAGIRLLRRIRRQEKRTMRVASYHGDYTGEVAVREEEAGGSRPARASRSRISAARAQLRRQPTQFENQEYERRHSSFSKTTRKISIITYATAILGLIYSVFSAASLIVISFFVFHNCLGYNGRGNSTTWLVTMIATRSSELPLALVMLYAITDVTNALAVMRSILCCHRCRKVKPAPQNAMPTCSCSNGTSSDCIHKSRSTESLSLAPKRTVVHVESREQLIHHHSTDDHETTTEGSQVGRNETRQQDQVLLNGTGTQTDKTNHETTFVTIENHTDPASETGSVVPRRPTVYFLNAQLEASTTSAEELLPSENLSHTPIRVTTDRGTQTTQHTDRAVQTNEHIEIVADDENVASSCPETMSGLKFVHSSSSKRKPHHLVVGGGNTISRFVRKFTI